MFAAPEVRVGTPLGHGRLTVFPLFAPTPNPVSYRLADDALADGTTTVEEVTEGGSVPQLSVVNTGEALVLFLEGQELRGAKQNRVLNTSVLVPARQKTVLPVSCVEQGRWRYTSRHFAPSGSHASSKLRRVLKSSANQSSYAGHGHGSDQGAVWAEVSRQMGSLGAASETGAMADTYSAHGGVLRDHLTKLAYPEGAVGLAVAVGDKLVMVDLFDAPETCRKVWPRLLTGAVLDAVESTDTPAPPTPAAVEAALAELRAGPWQTVAPAGTGEEYRGEPAGRWHGSVLAHGGVVVHGSLVLAS